MPYSFNKVVARRLNFQRTNAFVMDPAEHCLAIQAVFDPTLEFDEWAGGAFATKDSTHSKRRQARNIVN
jgi:hypothetical protein